jgi:hypothetical protein
MGWRNPPGPAVVTTTRDFPLPNDANCVEDDRVHGRCSAGGGRWLGRIGTMTPTAC